MSRDMHKRVKAEFAAYDSATTALYNAFGFVDDPKEWADDPEEHAEIWHEAAGAARSVQDAAEALAEAARKVANALDLALDEAEPT